MIFKDPVGLCGRLFSDGLGIQEGSQEPFKIRRIAFLQVDTELFGVRLAQIIPLAS